ncbi:MAG: tetraacyldisaccharide 4'-kinase [Ignavibacteria bacterium CG_4_8_14_3_um_filter_37_9]|nr:tetraacyldisaccharide 4'-kinase [Ignavibacteria bacterium]PIP77665.1 MAG: tetraacyldisaccharide 4'-kinase [Ignavibacteria bacterium CG22_combo_CG10-13_8_21_14_all_37_15]PIS45796.1 MAG: tetraacyldisaccharide 4'-kinase [Ignavibacteria bacterium CG08_land_8_20_14_0_20_37_9]PIW98709.1 MAG: tetraacyldisaccharide 4'-kinase [Ignavibacteria bacterium CG_4_8_14_3_um_filter_37_9]PJC60377.1 MAG: tetraacyldisaccharide 4'-kinase [Ignavibacteria bacterium CG_4_9_14_0_2_um_filter_37_13]
MKVDKRKIVDGLRLAALPLVPIYALITAIRNFLFDAKIFPSTKVDATVISVGNLTVGGSGKTPLVVYLTNLMKQSDKKVAVLSRGYGRKSTGFLFVSDGNQLITTVEECGDEIYQTVLECSVPAAVCESRVEGAKQLLAKAGVDTIILDDAFQHRWLFRDLDILIFEQRFLLEASSLRRTFLPTGMLREDFSSIRRADIIVLNRKFSGRKEIPGRLQKYFETKKVFTAHYSAKGFFDIKKKTFYESKEFEGQNSLVISGIANPHSFFNALEQLHVDSGNRMVFRDHKFYTREDIQIIRKQFYATNVHSVITTQKDAVKLMQFTKELDDIDIYYLKIELQFDNEKDFIKEIFKKLSEPKTK